MNAPVALTPELLTQLTAIVGENRIKTDADSLENWGRDHTKHFDPNPSVIVFPSSTEQVQAVVKLANEFNVAITPSGGRTGLSAGAVAANGEIVVSMDKMNQILEFFPADRMVRVQAGVVTEQLQNYAEEFISPLRNIPNVILTPHVGGSTMEAQANIGLEVAEKFVSYSDKGMTLSAVNFPEIALPLTEGKHRLLHIHKNVPGVLSKINNLFAEHGINISGQSLMTKGDVGYLVMDVDATASQEALDTLQDVEGTIRVRVLF